MTAVDAVLFDLDDTLCAYRRSTGELLDLAFERAGVEPFFEVEAYYDRFEEFLGETDDGVGLRERCFVDIAETRDHDPADARAVADAFAAERDQGAVEALDGAHAAVEALAADHHLGLITNGPPDMQREKLSAVGLDGAFDVEVFAGFDAPAKPDPAPFHHALDELGVDPERAVHVGNSLSSDVPGANAAGVGSVWLRQDGVDDAGAADHVLESLHDLTAPPWE